MDLPGGDGGEQPVNRLARRKMRTRAALVRAAQGFIAEGKLAVPILDITQAADVGMGSFYNHFESKEQLFEAALTDALDQMGALLDVFTESISDPAEAFVTRFRLSGRLFRHRPQEAALLLANAGSLNMKVKPMSTTAAAALTLSKGFTFVEAAFCLNRAVKLIVLPCCASPAVL